MNQTQITTTASSIPAILLVIFICLIAWHWVESGDGLSTGIKMTWQDTKVAVSCRSAETAFRFVGRRYEDFEFDRELFAMPAWKTFLCPIYENESFRTLGDRTAIMGRTWERLNKSQKDRIQEWAKIADISEVNGFKIQ